MRVALSSCHAASASNKTAHALQRAGAAVEVENAERVGRAAADSVAAAAVVKEEFGLIQIYGEHTSYGAKPTN